MHHLPQLKLRRDWSAALATLVALLVVSPRALAQHGMFLPDANTTTTTSSPRVHTWGNTGGMGNPTPFTAGVRDTTKNIDAGQLKFDYDTYTRNPGGTTGGGAALSGGFFANSNVVVKPGYDLIWVQTVNATRTGGEAASSWNLPLTGAGTYPDADPMDRPPPTFGPDDKKYAPSYPFNTPAVTPPTMMPTLGFQDFPARNFADGNQTWTAELGLACVSKTPNINMNGMLFREVRVIGTFLWGFDFNGLPAMPPGIGNIGGFGPSFWGPATGVYINALNDFYDGTGGGGAPDGMGGMLPGVASAKYRFANDTNCFSVVPEPGTIMLLMVAAGLLRRKRREG